MIYNKDINRKYDIAKCVLGQKPFPSKWEALKNNVNSFIEKLIK